jgi:hypothetical protein
MGGKSTAKTENLSLYKQERSNHKFAKSDWKIIDSLKQASEERSGRLTRIFKRYRYTYIQNEELLSHIEFEDSAYFEAFRVPQSSDGMKKVGKGGKAIGPDYLFHQWSNGWDAGAFKQHPHVQAAKAIWSMSPALRREKVAKWKTDIVQEQVDEIYRVSKQYNDYQTELACKFNEHVGAILNTKRIIGCTTTAAAKYVGDIQAARPGILLVEEAGEVFFLPPNRGQMLTNVGEILESHILTAMGANMRQLILIGDHKLVFPYIHGPLLMPAVQAASAQGQPLPSYGGEGRRL